MIVGSIPGFSYPFGSDRVFVFFVIFGSCSYTCFRNLCFVAIVDFVPSGFGSLEVLRSHSRGHQVSVFHSFSLYEEWRFQSNTIGTKDCPIE